MLGLDVLKLLAGGEFVSGQQLGKQLNISRTAVWNHIQAIRELGIEVYSVQGKGYRLAEPLELLDAAVIAGQVNYPKFELHVFEQLDSTNRYLMQHSSLIKPDHSIVCLAERQTSGRGRRGRHWVSPFGANIYLSLGRQFARGIEAIEGLSLVAALVVVQSFEDLGIEGVNIKWPNDIYFEGKKLAGILIEMAGEATGPCGIVLGIGLNVNMPEQAQQDIDQPWTDLRQICGESVSRNQVCAHMLQRLLVTLDDFEQKGFREYQSRWREYDMLRDMPVEIHTVEQPQYGIARGIDASGALLVEMEHGTQRVLSGDVSIRLT